MLRGLQEARALQHKLTSLLDQRLAKKRLVLTASGGGDDGTGGEEEEEEEGFGSEMNEELLVLVNTVFDCLSGSQQALRPGNTTHRLPLIHALPLTHPLLLTCPLSHTHPLPPPSPLINLSF